MQFAFLAKRESQAAGEALGYEFVPCAGPHSFELQRDLTHLARRGFLGADAHAEHVSIPQGQRGQTRKLVEQLPSDLLQGLADAAIRYADWRPDELLLEVCKRFPWYVEGGGGGARSDSPAVGLQSVPSTMYTIGYEGLTIDGVLAMLLRAGIQRILDVRRNPVSRKYGFSRSALEGLSADVGVEYRHYPELGVPSEMRGDLNTQASYERLWRWYREMLPRQDQAVGAAVDAVRSAPSALLCMEADHRKCHRSRLAAYLSQRTGLVVRHLGENGCWANAGDSTC